MQEALAQVYSYVLGVWRHRWLAIVIAWLVALAGWAYVWQLPESYVARARIFVDSNSVLRPLMRGLAITPNVDQRISMMSRTLLSRPNLEKLGRMTDLDLQVTTEAQKAAMIQRLDSAISLGGTRGNSSLYSIRVVDRDRDLAKRLTQSLITVFIEDSLSEKRADSTGAQSFLDERIAESEARLIEAENRLARFKQQNVDVLPGGGGGDYYSRLQGARGELAQAQLQLRELQNRRRELQRQLAGEEPVFLGSRPTVTGGPASPLDARIQSLETQLDNLLLRYTDRHPEVRQLQGLIAELESERDSQYDEAGDSGTGMAFSGAATSPVYQGMRSMLAETEARVAEMEVRVSEYEKRVEALAGKVNAIPEIEAQLKQLNRDYGVLSQRHQDLLSRRESARLSGEVEGSAGDVTFRVVDPPFVPLEPSEPDKLMLNAGVLVVALGAGVAAALVLSLLNPIVTDGRMLAHAAGLPLLGAVTFNKTEGQRRRDRWGLAGFSACVVALVAGFAGVVVAPGLIA